jgi:hypothetical protein
MPIKHLGREHLEINSSLIFDQWSLGNILFKKGVPFFKIDTLCGPLIIQELKNHGQETVSILSADLKVQYALKIDLPNDDYILAS